MFAGVSQFFYLVGSLWQAFPPVIRTLLLFGFGGALLLAMLHWLRGGDD